ncbi:MAG: hypothetical protein JOS17DRAFT_794532 [Linnemannia elongata]|nr:MAG: hypothetical protein JOS17DRAFT_794532 [Linnemannia elongata]
MSIQQLQHRQSNGMVLLTPRPRRNYASSIPSLLLLFLFFSLLLLTTSPSVNAATATTDSPTVPPSTKPHATKTSSTLLPSPTPTLIIPEQCQGCYGPNNTSGMTCFRNTQCVPVQYLCDSLSSLTCPSSSSSGGDGGGDGDSDNGSDGGSANVPILCQNQLCNPQNYPPLPDQYSGRINRAEYCLDGSFYSLYSGSSSSRSSTPMYTASCVEEFMLSATESSGGSDDDCKGPWEYFAIGYCFLKTCGPDMDCVPPFTCQLFNSTVPGVSTNASGGADQGYGICVDPNGSSSSSDGKKGGINGGSAAPKYSAREYLLQGLLIGLCTLALGVGLGVGFWRYKRKKQFESDHLEPHQQHRRRTSSSSHGHADHTHSRSHSRSSRSRDYQHRDGQEELDAESMPPPPPLQSLNNSGTLSSSNSSTKKRPPAWYSFLLCGPCSGRRQSSHTTSRRVGGSRTMHSSSSLNRLSTLELDHHSHHQHNRTGRGRRDSRAGEITETETDSQDDSSIHYHHPHRRNSQPRWRWGHPNNTNTFDGDSNPMMMIMLPRHPPPSATTGTGGAVISTSTRVGMTVVLPEFEPPPMYHRQDDEYGPNLPTYGDISNSGTSSSVNALEQLQEQGQTESPLPPLPPPPPSPPLSSTATAVDPDPAQDQESSLEESGVPIVSSPSTRSATPLPPSLPPSETDSNQQRQQ